MNPGILTSVLRWTRVDPGAAGDPGEQPHRPHKERLLLNFFSILHKGWNELMGMKLLRIGLLGIGFF